jgi:hypothetical protein
LTLELKVSLNHKSHKTSGGRINGFNYPQGLLGSKLRRPKDLIAPKVSMCRLLRPLRLTPKDSPDSWWKLTRVYSTLGPVGTLGYPIFPAYHKIHTDMVFDTSQKRFYFDKCPNLLKILNSNHNKK